MKRSKRNWKNTKTKEVMQKTLKFEFDKVVPGSDAKGAEWATSKTNRKAGAHVVSSRKGTRAANARNAIAESNSARDD